VKNNNLKNTQHKYMLTFLSIQTR